MGWGSVVGSNGKSPDYWNVRKGIIYLRYSTANLSFTVPSVSRDFLVKLRGGRPKMRDSLLPHGGASRERFKKIV